MIEKARADDVQDILFVINTSNREAYKSIFPKEHFKEPVLSFEELLEDFGRMTFYVYRSEDKIVGVAALSVESEEKGQLHWVYILPEYQRKGIGTALVRHVEGESREKGLRNLKLLTTGRAKWAIEFYKKLGYRLIEKIERPWGFDVVMERNV